jgi:flagellar biosynthesis protein FliQ
MNTLNTNVIDFYHQYITVIVILLIGAFFISLLIELLVTLYERKRDDYMLTIIPDLVYVNQRINIIKHFINNNIIKISNSNNETFTENIKPDTKLTYIQYKSIKYIKELELLNEKWLNLSYHGLFVNFKITSPYGLAYCIREILNLKINIDDDNDENAWLSVEEIDCLKNNENYENIKNNDDILIKNDKSIIYIDSYIDEILKNAQIKKFKEEEEEEEKDEEDDDGRSAIFNY